MNVLRSVAGMLIAAAILAVCCVSMVNAATQEHRSVQELVERLASPSADERKEAREGLLLLGAAAVPPLVLATESDDATVRWEAVNLLGSLGHLRATDAVLLTFPTPHSFSRGNF